MLRREDVSDLLYVARAHETTGTFNVAYSASDAGSGVANVALWYNVNGGTWNNYGTYTSSPISFTTTIEGTYGFYTISTDKAGNVENAKTAAEATTIFDLDIESLAINSPTGGQTVNTAAVPVSGIASDTASGLQKVEVQFDTGGWSLASGTSTWSYTTPALSDGSHTINVKATDNAGNSETVSVTVNVLTTSTVTFTETGLPASASWRATFNGVTKSSTTSTITFSGIAAGSYPWSVSTPIGSLYVRYVTSTASGTMSVPTTTSQNVAYNTQYQVSFRVNPAGAGTTNPTGTGVWENAGSLPISATVNTGYSFTSWSSSTKSKPNFE